MSPQVARFDFSCFDEAYHQETLDNLKTACANVRKLCAVMLDTRGPEITVTKAPELEIALVAGQTLVLTTDLSVPPSTQALPVSYEGLPSVVKPGDSSTCPATAPTRLRCFSLCSLLTLCTTCSFRRPVPVHGLRDQLSLSARDQHGRNHRDVRGA